MTTKAIRKYLRIRSSLLRKGLTVRSWALKNGFPVGTVYGAVRGERSGKKAQTIMEKLKESYEL